MRFTGSITALALIAAATPTLAASCDPIPPTAPLPVTINGYVVGHKTPGTATDVGPNGEIPLQGGLTVEFVGEHVGTVLEFLGGSVGDVDPFVTLAATGGVVPLSGIAVPKSPGTSVKAALYTRGVTKLELVSQNNEGTLVSICSED